MDDMLPALLKLAIDAARLPSQLILSGFRSETLSAERKSDGSPVTNFDRDAERMIRAYLAEHSSGDWPVLGEEFGGEGTESARYRWVVDPIDGTLPFTRGLPTFGTLLAFEDVVARRSLVGVIHLPAMNETYFAARGLGAWCAAGSGAKDGVREGQITSASSRPDHQVPQGQRIHVAPPRALRDCLISAPAEHHFRLAGVADTHEQLRAQAPHLRSSNDCWAHAMVARGSIDVLTEFRLSRWDIAATEVIIEEAGGVALIREASYDVGKYDCIIGSPAAARDVATILRFT